jgi:selenocysteine lyase/cysteine desulfurase
LPITPYKTGGTGFSPFDLKPPEDMPERFEAGILNAHGLAGLLAGVRFISQVGRENIAAHERALTQQFILGLQGMPHFTVFGGEAPVVSVAVEGKPSAEVAAALWEKHQIATRAGFHCAPLHRYLGTAETGLTRFSFSWFNTPDEVHRAVQALRDIR